MENEIWVANKVLDLTTIQRKANLSGYKIN